MIFFLCNVIINIYAMITVSTLYCFCNWPCSRWLGTYKIKNLIIQLQEISKRVAFLLRISDIEFRISVQRLVFLTEVFREFSSSEKYDATIS
jgi:hypothetical protein